MNTREAALHDDRALEGMRVLAMLSQVKGDYARRLLGALEHAKERWGWEINMLCRPVDRSAIDALLAPSGTVFPYPEMLKPLPWEAEPTQAADIERRLAEAERAAGVPVGRLVAGSPASVGRAYVVSARNRLSSPMADRILKDNSEPFRIVRRYFGFAEDILDKCQADAVFAIEWGTPLHLAVWMSATGRGIPCIVLRRSKILTDLAHWSTDRLMLNTRAREDAERRRRTSAPLSDLAKTYLQTYRDQPRVAKVVETKWKNTGVRWEQEVKSWLVLPYRYARAVALDIVYRVRGVDTTQRAPAFERVIAPRMRAIVGRRHQRYFRTFSDSELAEMNYIYFPIHKETDMPLVYQATTWQNQLNTIQVIAASLPFAYKLLVREHRSNFGQRPKHYYPSLTPLPNVMLIDPFDSQFKYLRHASLIVTENGSSGWEGLMFGRKVLTVADNFYDGAGLADRVYDLNRLSAKVLEVLDRPASSDAAEYDRQLGHMIDAEAATVFPADRDGTTRAVEMLAELLGELLSEGAAPKRAVGS